PFGDRFEVVLRILDRLAQPLERGAAVSESFSRPLYVLLRLFVLTGGLVQPHSQVALPRPANGKPLTRLWLRRRCRRRQEGVPDLPGRPSEVAGPTPQLP